MKSIVILVLVLTLSGCSFSSIPTVLEVHDSNGQLVGRAFAIDGDQFVTADHVFQEHQPIFVDQKLVTVQQRDRANDWLRFSLPKKFVHPQRFATFKTKSLKVGSEVFWPGGRGTVLDLDSSVDFERQSYANIITVSGQVVPGDSGWPVYDKNNLVVGMIIGGEKGKVYLTSKTPSIESGTN